jgi:hypothetical protein
MPAMETLKKITQKATGWARPAPDSLDTLVRARKPQTFRFKDDGIIPNHPRWPIVLYRGAVRLDKHFDPASVFEVLFPLSATAGAIPGATAFTITCTIIPAFMRC